jgi:multiple sugar transport system ATP-binding protein
VIVGVRPEHFEDAAIEPERPGLMKFMAKVDVVESMGSELYAYFDVETTQEVQSDDLADLAKDAGLEDLPTGGGQHVVARLDSDSKASAGGEIELVIDTTELKLFDPDGGRSLTYGGVSDGAGSKAASAANN